MDSFRDQQGHLARPSVTNGVNKDFCAVVLSLSPGVWPPENDRVGFHPTQSTGLNPGSSFVRGVREKDSQLTCDRYSR